MLKLDDFNIIEKWCKSVCNDLENNTNAKKF